MVFLVDMILILLMTLDNILIINVNFTSFWMLLPPYASLILSLTSSHKSVSNP